MIGKHDPGVDVEWRAGADLPNRIPQRVDLCDQQVRPAVKQVRCEEERSARNPIATIIWYGGIMPGVEKRRKALPRGSSPRAEGFSALVIPKPRMFEPSRKGRPALGGDPEQGGWRRIDPPLAGRAAA